MGATSKAVGDNSSSISGYLSSSFLVGVLTGAIKVLMLTRFLECRSIELDGSPSLRSPALRGVAQT